MGSSRPHKETSDVFPPKYWANALLLKRSSKGAFRVRIRMESIDVSRGSVAEGILSTGCLYVCRRRLGALGSHLCK